MQAVSQRYPLTPVRNHPGIYAYEVRKGAPNQRRRYQAVATVKGRQRWSGGHKTIAAAEAALSDLRRSLAGGASSVSVRLTTRDYLEQHWLPSVDVSAGTERAYRYFVKRVVDSPMGDVRLIDLTPHHIEAFKRHMRDRGLATSTRHSTFVALSLALEYARRQKMILVNPCADVTAPPRGKHTPPVLDAATVGKLLTEAEHEGWGCLLWLVMDTGLRSESEAYRLTWEDVDFATGVLRIPKAKTDAGVRAVALGAESIRRLQQHRLEQMKRYRDLGAPPPALVFVWRDGRRLTQQLMWTTWDRIRRAAGQPELHFHDLRHLAATVLARMGVPPAIAAERLGHASAMTTLDVYTQTTTRDQAAAADALASWLGRL